ncbi:TetR/AcrR family transcriptional regulator [Reyranella sp.]|uniref:TetR/AcrR family transcriptional regulator n=1 Tax=Reyranella sp. TaxID=1929291 RepID=UPI003BADB9AC
MARPASTKRPPPRPAGEPARPRAAAASSSSDLLLATAERLYAERGLDGVSMREIAREAEQKNNSALHYHFGSKEALLDAIIRLRMREVDALRNAFLDACEEKGLDDLRTAVEALVRPLAHGLLAGRPDNYYNRFLAAAQIHPDIDLAAHASEESQRGFRRVYARLERALPRLPSAVLSQRYLTGIALVTFSLADFERIRARKARERGGFDMQRAVENLIDMIAGALAAPVSEPVRSRLDGSHTPTRLDRRAS